MAFHHPSWQGDKKESGCCILEHANYVSWRKGLEKGFSSFFFPLQFPFCVQMYRVSQTFPPWPVFDPWSHFVARQRPVSVFAEEERKAAIFRLPFSRLTCCSTDVSPRCEQNLVIFYFAKSRPLNLLVIVWLPCAFPLKTSMLIMNHVCSHVCANQESRNIWEKCGRKICHLRKKYWAQMKRKQDPQKL